ncbi:Protein DlpA [Phytophthora citrophthora]|uniref:Protein DlpA n=1 Tax=Phytophthora citrophthora TaxID=4793 RepID=A0AAD9GXE4_9STRA|nr:Protein DlpA [Phytophthora citrophthora]
MGRKPSNVYDYFDRLEAEPGYRGLVRYQCKKCSKQYASNATRLAEHLKQSCEPSFQTNQRPRSTPKQETTHTTAPESSSSPKGSDKDEVEEEEEEDETEVDDGSPDAMATTVASLAVPPPTTETYVPPAPTALTLRRADQQLLSNMLEAEVEPPQDTTEILLRLAKLSTCLIGDAMAQMKIQGYLVDVDLVRGYDAPLAMNICGPALTVRMMPSSGSMSRSSVSYNYMDTAEMGQVVVISSPPGITTAVFGGLLATASKARNVAGVVTDGRVRDIQELCAINFPAFARSTSVHGVFGSTTIGEVNSNIIVAGCVVRPNDIIRGDINGVVVIPADRAQEVAMRAEIIEDQDSKIVEALNEGEPLQRSLHRFRSSRNV